MLRSSHLAALVLAAAILPAGAAQKDRIVVGMCSSHRISIRPKARRRAIKEILYAPPNPFGSRGL